MPGDICYLGDDNLQGAAAYLGGIMLHFGLEFDYVPSTEPRRRASPRRRTPST